MYHAQVYVGAGGSSSREGRYGLEAGGGSPLTGNPGQLYPQGGYHTRPMDGPPGVEEGGPPRVGDGGLPGSGGGGDDANLALQENSMLLPMNGSLKGTAPAIFGGNRKNMMKFTQELMLYCIIN
jgi:hypothetical protein